MNTAAALTGPSTQPGTSLPPETNGRPALAVVATSRAASCEHHMCDDPTGLPCTRSAHTDGGHVYHDSHGSAVDDRHVDGGHG